MVPGVWLRSRTTFDVLNKVIDAGQLVLGQFSAWPNSKVESILDLIDFLLSKSRSFNSLLCLLGCLGSHLGSLFEELDRLRIHLVNVLAFNGTHRSKFRSQVINANFGQLSLHELVRFDRELIDSLKTFLGTATYLRSNLAFIIFILNITFVRFS